MTESKLELADNTSYSTLDELFADIKAHDEWVSSKGKHYRVRGANAFDLFRLVRRFPKARALVHNLADFMFGAGSDRDTADLLAKFNTRTIVDILLDVGDDAAAAFVQICFNLGGEDLNQEEVEHNIMKLPTNEFLSMMSASMTATFGGKSATDFFTGLLIEFEKMGIRRGGEPKKRAATKANRQASKTLKQAA